MNSSEVRAVAIVGVGALLPDAPNATALWENVCGKRYSIVEVPSDRWSIHDYFDPDPAAPDKTYSKIGGWVQGFNFDWKKYRVPPRVAEAMDESQKWAVTVADMALADYGYPNRHLDLERTGAVIGTAMGGETHYRTALRASFPEYSRALMNTAAYREVPAQARDALMEQWRARIGEALPSITEDSMPGELPNVVAGRIANVLNLRGPNFITDAACASSFAAIQAATDLLYGADGTPPQCDAVLAGGVDRNMGAPIFIKFCKIGALSATGTRPFADGADGFVMGEGAGIFLLKRLSDAERDGDRIYAVIRGIGASSDGRGKGITAPNPAGQQLAIARAWQQAGLDPTTASLVEAHGTSTRVGDVVEVESLTHIFCGARPGSIALGSVKSNIGHLKAAAGAAGLLKTAMALYHKTLPPTLYAQPANRNIPFDATPFYLNHDAAPWEARTGTPRRAGVSAYGFGGTNFHLVVEEYVPGGIVHERRSHAAAIPQNGRPVEPASPATPVRSGSGKIPLRGILALGGETPEGLAGAISEALRQVREGWTPPLEPPCVAVLSAPERLVVDFGDHAELQERLAKTEKAARMNAPAAWKALQAQGVFRGSGPSAGKLAFLFPGQGSQYLGMGRTLAAAEPTVAQIFADADEVMEPVLGRPLTSYVFVDEKLGPEALGQAERDLMQTAITQPAMLTMDVALERLLHEYGFAPDLLMGHSLGEYAALIVSGIMPFADALEAAAARGREMTRVSMDDNGWMAAVMAPLQVVDETLSEVDGYVVAANVNSYNQCVVGGASKAVEQAVQLFQRKGYQAQRIPVSHAFHTRIVAPASGPLRQVLERLHVYPPRIPLVANVTGDLYPTAPRQIIDMLEQQIASPVQWVKGLQTLYAAGARTFVEVGPKKALKGFVDDVLGARGDVLSLFTNHPKVGELASFNQAICGLYAAGYGASVAPENAIELAGARQVPEPKESVRVNQTAQTARAAGPDLVEALAEALQRMAAAPQPHADRPARVYDRNAEPAGSVVITGTGLGLPGAEKSVMDPENAQRLLRGEQFIDLIPERFRNRMVDKRVTRLVKGDDGSGHFEVIDDPADVVKLAGRPGSFNLSEEYGVPEKLVEAFDITTQLAMAAGLDALREAGIPLVQTYRSTTTGKYLPERWLLPEPLRDETGVIFASVFPGGDYFAGELSRYYLWRNRRAQLAALEDLRSVTSDESTLQEIGRRAETLRAELEREPYTFDRRFLFGLLSMGHSQFAEYIGARGPNTQVNAACATTAQAVAIAEDWIRAGRCRRVIVIGGDAVTSDNLLEWVACGFLASGAAATDDNIAEAALPFDKRRHGTIVGMGACALVIESEDAVRERGMRGIVELLNAETCNSAFHGTRLDVDHISGVMDSLVTTAERRFGLDRNAIAQELLFVSHETYTPARGGSASAEVAALRHVFGPAAGQVIVTNTKGWTGHAMGVGIEDVVAIKALEYGIVPPVANFKEVDPELGRLNLSRGGRYPVHYALHLAAGFGSQISMTLLRKIPGGLDRVDNKSGYRRWLSEVSGLDHAETEVVKRVLRIRATAEPGRAAIASLWNAGTGPAVRAAAYGPTGERVPYRQEWQPLAAPSIVQRSNGTHSGHGAGASHGAPRAPEPVVAEPEPIRPERAPVAPQVAAPAEDAPVVNDETSAQAPQAAPGATPAGAGADPVSDQVLKLVADKTGYPPEMLEADLDLEADLGIDTVKQAETFAAIREMFDIPRLENLKLRDYPTLAHVIGFVKQMRPDLVSAATAEPERPAAGPAVGAAAPTPELAGPQTDPILTQVLQLVADKTGYPPEMLEADLDLEADLGIDTVKQAETFVAIRETFGISRQDNLKLRDYPTLGHVVQFVREMRPDLAAPVAPSEQRTVPDSTPAQTAADPVEAAVLRLVADKTGYPEEMLELDLDLEADLGVDTVKQAETFLAIREMYAIPRGENLRLRDYPTLGHVIRFVKEMRPDLDHSPDRVGGTPAAAPAPEALVEPLPAVSRPSAASLEAADAIPRRVPVPALRPPLGWCKPTGVTLAAGDRVVVMGDRGEIGETLASLLRERGVQPLLLAPGQTAAALVEQLAAWQAEGPVTGVYWLPALDREPLLVEMDRDAFRTANVERTKNLYAVMRALYDQISSPGTFLVSATAMGGMHGYDDEGAEAPLGGAVCGFTKAYKRERPEALVKAVDFGDQTLSEIATALVAETLGDPGCVEVGYRDGMRFTVTLEERSAVDGGPGMVLGKDSIFLVTGAAGGITSAIVADLAAASAGTFYLLDRVPVPDPADRRIALFREGREELKGYLIETLKSSGVKATPARVNREISAVEREEAALRGIEAVEAAGGKAHYRAVDLLDGGAVTAVVNEIRAAHGRIDVLLHAGGLEISRGLADKEPDEFDLVFDVKVEGLYNLLRAAEGMPLGAIVAFSSVAGRFGNAGQTDYSAANDLLCKVTSNLRRARPETRGIVIDWTAWAGIGMATRGSIPKIMEMAGIDMLPPEAGVPTIRRELTYGSTRGELLVGQRLGILLSEWDETGGLDAEAATMRAAEAKLPMIGEVKAARLNGGLEVETTLDPNEQPFLVDHQIDGTPTLPGVMGTEAFAEIASLLAPGYRVVCVEGEEFLSPFKFYRCQPRTLLLSAQLYPAADGELVARTVLESIAPTPGGGDRRKTHFTARVRLSRTVERAEAPLSEAPQIPQAGGRSVGAESIYQVYFHGPSYQVLEKAWVHGDTAIGLLAAGLPPDTQPDGAPLLMSPRLVEFCFQTAGIWEIVTRKALALPMSVRRVRAYRPYPVEGTGQLYAHVHTSKDGFDAEVVDEAGHTYVRLEGYRTIGLPDRTVELG